MFAFGIFNLLFFRRMKRWVQEKQQRDKSASTTQARRHRYKSVGDVEPSSNKTKRQPQAFSRVNECLL